MRRELMCEHCKGSFYSIRLRKYCSAICSNLAHIEKRKIRGTIPERKTTPTEKFVAKEFFDWREYPYTVII